MAQLPGRITPFRTAYVNRTGDAKAGGATTGASDRRGRRAPRGALTTLGLAISSLSSASIPPPKRLRGYLTGGTIVLRPLCYLRGVVGDGGMARAKQRKTPARRGRPPGSRYGAVFQLRLSKDTEAAVFKWAANNDITRSEAMRRLLELGLKKTPPKAKSGRRSAR